MHITALPVSIIKMTSCTLNVVLASATLQSLAWFPKSTIFFLSTFNLTNNSINSAYTSASTVTKRMLCSQSRPTPFSRMHTLTTDHLTTAVSSPTELTRKADAASVSLLTTCSPDHQDNPNNKAPFQEKDQITPRNLRRLSRAYPSARTSHLAPYTSSPTVCSAYCH